LSGTSSLLLLIVIVIVAFVLVFYIQRLFVKKAMREVVSRFRKLGATSPEKATSLEQLGLVPPDFLRRMGRVRDYKPQALRLLVQRNIIKGTGDGRVYLSEAALRDSPLKEFAGLE